MEKADSEDEAEESNCFCDSAKHEEMLPNMRAVYDRTNGKKVVFTRMMPYEKDRMDAAIQAVYSSKVVVTDDYFYLFRKFGKKPGQKIVQLWHAAGAFKKFGMEEHRSFRRWITYTIRIMTWYP